MIDLLIRADAGPRIGAGHLMRCLALAQACQDRGGAASFACNQIDHALREHLLAEGLVVHSGEGRPGGSEDAARLTALAGQVGAPWLVLDGYAFGADYQRTLKEAGHRLLVLDDCGQVEHYHADVVLNQNGGAEPSLYAHRDEGTQLLLGLDYLLLRREFQPWRGWQRQVPPLGRKLLVTLGGSDVHRLLVQLVRAIQQARVDGLEVVILAGDAASSPELLAAAADARGAIRIQAHSSDMPALMAWADIAIAAAGSNSWERAFMGLPSLTVVLADNQRGVASFCERHEVAINLGRSETLDYSSVSETLRRLSQDQERRSAMARRGPALVDGKGASRVLSCLQERDLHLRRAREEDCRQLWEWANDPDTRAVSFSREPIPWERHCAWFASRLADANCELFLALSSGKAIGQVRFDLNGPDAVISISLDAQCRGRGLGPVLIRKASRELLERGRVQRIHAYIDPANQASQSAFARAGYVPADEAIVSGRKADHMILSK